MMRGLRRKARPAIALFGLLWIACSVSDPLPRDADEFTPSPLYALWWSDVEACSGLTRPISEVRWYTVPYHQATQTAATPDGYYDFDFSRIVLLDGVLLDGVLVRHEMLHALIGKAPGTLH